MLVGKQTTSKHINTISVSSREKQSRVRGLEGTGRKWVWLLCIKRLRKAQ